MTDDEEPVAKRARVETVAEDSSAAAAADDDWQALLDGSDNFVSQADRQAAEAERRRAQRRERLRRLAAAEQGGGSGAAIKKEPEIKDEETLRSQLLVQEPINDKSDARPAVKEESSSNVQPQTDKESGIESFDMFTSSPPPPPQGTNNNTTVAGKLHGAAAAQQSQRGQGQQDWDDAEGYYNAVIGEMIEVQDNPKSSDTAESSLSTAAVKLQFRVDGKIGQGVFSTVLKVTTLSNPSSVPIPPTAAVKMIRSNETMAKAANNEIRFLHQLRDARGVIPLLLPTTVNPMEHRGHVLLVFPFMEYNLRDVLQKYGKGVGVSLPAVRSYFGQLLSALTHLKKRGIIHADIKPDNILINGDFSTVYLADFGSAFEATAPENQPTPYLVSRFYRAPEIILGLTPTIGIDLWSLAVSVAELFLGNVLFRGKSNNDMLYVFMQHLGPFSNRMVRQHMVQLGKLPTLARHFQTQGPNFEFLQQTVDTVTGTAIHKRLALVAAATTTSAGSNQPKFPLATPLSQRIMRAKSASDSRTDVQRFGDLLNKCLALDPSRRIALKDALGHEFFRSNTAAASAPNKKST